MFMYGARLPEVHGEPLHICCKEFRCLLTDATVLTVGPWIRILSS